MLKSTSVSVLEIHVVRTCRLPDSLRARPCCCYVPSKRDMITKYLVELLMPYFGHQTRHTNRRVPDRRESRLCQRLRVEVLYVVYIRLLPGRCSMIPWGLLHGIVFEVYNLSRVSG